MDRIEYLTMFFYYLNYEIIWIARRPPVASIDNKTNGKTDNARDSK